MTGLSDGMGTVATQVRLVLFGRDDVRLRAIWRFVLAWPLLPLVGALVAAVMPVLGLSGMIPGGPLQGIIFVGILVAWARIVDRRPLTDYGVVASRSWLIDFLVALVVVVGVWSGWYAIASSLGWVQLELSLTAPQDSVVVGLLGTLVSLVINTWVQDVVFFAIVLASAAEGFHSRGVDPRQAVIGGWGVGILFFTVIHGTPTVLDTVGTAVGGAVFGLLYVHTGELALSIGVHGGASYTAASIFPAQASQAASLFAVTKALPYDIGGEIRILLYLATYVLLVAWLRLSRGDITIDSGLAQWTERR